MLRSTSPNAPAAHSMPFAQAFPLDVIYLILRQCCIPSLKHALLVNHDWYTLGSPRLLQSSSIVLGATGRNLGWSEVQVLQEAIALFSGESRSRIRRLRLNFCAALHPFTPLLMPRLLAAVSQCPNLEDLQLFAGGTLNRPVADALCSLKSFPVSLRSYSSDLARLDTPFFENLPHLSSLSILPSVATWCLDSSPAASIPLSQLATLKAWSSADLRYMAGAPVTDLSLSISCSDDPTSIRNAILAASVPLERLQLVIRDASNPLKWYTDLLSHLTHLRHLVVVQDVPYQAVPTNDASATVTAVGDYRAEWRELASLRHLEEFTLQSSSINNAQSSSQEADWDLAVIQSCAALQRVTIAHSPSQSTKQQPPSPATARTLFVETFERQKRLPIASAPSLSLKDVAFVRSDVRFCNA